MTPELILFVYAYAALLLGTILLMLLLFGVARLLGLVVRW